MTFRVLSGVANEAICGFCWETSFCGIEGNQQVDGLQGSFHFSFPAYGTGKLPRKPLFAAAFQTLNALPGVELSSRLA